MAGVIQGLSLWLHFKVFRGNIRSTPPVSCDVKAAVKSSAVGVEPSSLYQSFAVTHPKTSIPDRGYRRTKRLVGFACVTFPKLGNQLIKLMVCLTRKEVKQNHFFIYFKNFPSLHVWNDSPSHFNKKTEQKHHFKCPNLILNY